MKKYIITVPIKYDPTALSFRDHEYSYDKAYFYFAEPLTFKEEVSIESRDFKDTQVVYIEIKSDKDFFVKIEHAYGKNEEEAIASVIHKCERICSALNLIITQNNVNIHLFQPKLAFFLQDLKASEIPYEEFEKYQLLKNKDREFRYLYDGFKISDAYAEMTIKQTIPIDEFQSVYNAISDRELSYIFNSFTSALGTEDYLAKFFHLFSIIEYIERNYTDEMGEATKVFLPEDIKAIKCSFGDICKGLSFSRIKRDRVVNKIGELNTVTNLNRNQKLLNILKNMGISQVKQGVINFNVDDKFVSDIIKKRNTKFHGDLEVSRELNDVTNKLMSVCLLIIRYFRTSK